MTRLSEIRIGRVVFIGRRASLVWAVRDAEREVGLADHLLLRRRALELAVAEGRVRGDQATLVCRRPDVVADGEQPAGLHVVPLVRAAGRPALLLGRRERGEALRLVRQALRRARHAGAALEARPVRLLERARALGRRLVVAVVRVPRAFDALLGRRAEGMRCQRGRGGRGGGRRGGLGGGRGGFDGGRGYLRVHRAREERNAR